MPDIFTPARSTAFTRSARRLDYAGSLFCPANFFLFTQLLRMLKLYADWNNPSLKCQNFYEMRLVLGVGYLRTRYVPFGKLMFLHFAFTLHSDRLIMDDTVDHCIPYTPLIFISVVFHSYVSILSNDFPVR